MLIVEARYKDGKVELSETPVGISEARVPVTFLIADDIDLRVHGITEEQAQELRGRLATFEDWNDPEMDIYNDYSAMQELTHGRD
ncbi:MAG TPA: hypothetical protein VFV34_11415 [Blastocatellia bacterium]|nr:hypothetical protein [Blastocatellia bacterium]